MKKSKNNIISDWLDKYSDPKIEEQVKLEIENGLKSPIVNIKNNMLRSSSLG